MSLDNEFNDEEENDEETTPASDAEIIQIQELEKHFPWLGDACLEWNRKSLTALLEVTLNPLSKELLLKESPLSKEQILLGIVRMETSRKIDHIHRMHLGYERVHDLYSNSYVRAMLGMMKAPHERTPEESDLITRMLS